MHGEASKYGQKIEIRLLKKEKIVILHTSMQFFLDGTLIHSPHLNPCQNANAGGMGKGSTQTSG
jgi:hypothetical protein